MSFEEIPVYNVVSLIFISGEEGGGGFFFAFLPIPPTLLYLPRRLLQAF